MQKSQTLKATQQQHRHELQAQAGNNFQAESRERKGTWMASFI